VFLFFTFILSSISLYYTYIITEYSMPAHVHPKNIASAINVLMSLFYPLVFLTDLLEVETESFPRGVSITDESHSQYIPG